MIYLDDSINTNSTTEGTGDTEEIHSFADPLCPLCPPYLRPALHKPDFHIRPLLQMDAVDEAHFPGAQGQNHG
jgi:hypothetical protein